MYVVKVICIVVNEKLNYIEVIAKRRKTPIKQAEIRTILFKRYYKEPLPCIEIHINDAEKHYTTKEGWYYEVRHWRYGAYLGVDKCFAIGEGDTLKQYVEDTMDDNHADDVVLTNGNTIISINLF